MHASKNSAAAIINLLIKHGANVNAIDHSGNTALIHAAYGLSNSINDVNASQEPLRILLDAGSDVYAVNFMGYSALFRGIDTESSIIFHHAEKIDAKFKVAQTMYAAKSESYYMRYFFPNDEYDINAID